MDKNKDCSQTKTAEYQHPFAGAMTMLQVLNRCKTTADARDLEMAILPLDALELIRSWVVYEALGFQKCCRNGLDGVLRYVAGTHFYTAIHFSPVKTTHEKDEMFTGVTHAIERGHLGVARLLIECGAREAMECNCRWKAYYWLTAAISSGTVELVALLLHSGMDPGPSHYFGCIMRALKENQFEIAKLFIKKLEIPLKKAEAEDLLNGVCTAGNVDMMKFLLEQDPTLKTDTRAWAHACSTGSLDIVDYLLENRVDDIKSSGATCGLMEASAANNTEVIRHLEKGVDIHAQNDCAFILACSHGSTDVVKYLVARGVDVNTRAEPGEKCMWLRDGTRSTDELTEVFRHPCEAELIWFCALVPCHRILRVNTDEVTPVAMASANGHLDVVKFLIKHGADVHAHDEHALRLACEGGHVEMVDFLVTECNADVHAVDDEALRLASFNGECDVVKALVEYGADSTRALRFLLFEVRDAYYVCPGFSDGVVVVHALVNVEVRTDLLERSAYLSQALASRFAKTAETTRRLEDFMHELKQIEDFVHELKQMLARMLRAYLFAEGVQISDSEYSQSDDDSDY